MSITELERHLLGENLICTRHDEECTVFQASDGSGSMKITTYSVFPGIWLIYNDVHIPRFSICIDHEVGDIIEIEHCREGRIECQEDDNYFYLAQGDISLRKKTGAGRELEFPLSHYHGLAILIDLKQTPRCLTCLLEDVEVEPERLVHKFGLGENHHVALRQLPSIEHIFSDLYTVPDSIRKGYHKVKVLEILLFLSALEPERDALQKRRLTRAQVTLAKEAYQHLTENLDDRITIEELAGRLDTSQTQLKTAFRAVYGTSIKTFLREQKMQMAARLLRETDRTVMDIAGEFGYANASKFSSAFQNAMGMTPTQYRLTSRRMDLEGPAVK